VPQEQAAVMHQAEPMVACLDLAGSLQTEELLVLLLEALPAATCLLVADCSEALMGWVATQAVLAVKAETTRQAAVELASTSLPLVHIAPQTDRPLAAPREAVAAVAIA